MKKILIALAGLVFAVIGAQNSSADELATEYVHGTGSYSVTADDISVLQSVAKNNNDPSFTPERFGALLGAQKIQASGGIALGPDMLRIGFDNVNLRVHVVMRTELTAVQRGILESLPVDTQVDVCPTCLSDDQLNDLQIQLVHQLSAQFPNSGCGSIPDPWLNSISFYCGDALVETQSGDGNSEFMDARTYSEAVLTDYLKTIVPDGVAFTVSEDQWTLEPESGTPYITGGEALSSPACTGGFVVTKSGLTGISTTDHCIAPGTTYETNEALGQHSGGSSNGAVAWIEINSLPTATFRSDVSAPGNIDFLDVTSAQNPGLNSIVCLYGAQSGRNCATVVTQKQCVAGTVPQICNSYVLSAAVTVAGDSGGPVHMGTVASGIIFGRVTTNLFGVRTVFSAISNLAEMGVHVVTTSDFVGIA